MMRTVVLAIAGTLLAITALLTLTVGLQLLPPTIILAVITAGLAFERQRYKANHPDRPGPGWTRTAERFTDPATGDTVRVYFNPATGERRYVAE